MTNNLTTREAPGPPPCVKRHVGACNEHHIATPAQPLFPIHTPTAQAILTTLTPANVEIMQGHERAFVVDAGPDLSFANSGDTVRLLAYYTPAVPALSMQRRGLAILLHGWEGCSHSIFNLGVGTALVRAGYDVIRLNLRDHGPSVRLDPIRLNEGLFLGTLLAEARCALAAVHDHWAHSAGGDASLPVFLIGASLGGNFVLRLAASAADAMPTRLTRAIAVSPVVDPARSVDLIDANPPFRNYFRNRWLHSLQRKEAAFPQRYNFAGIERLNRVRPMTEWLVRRYTDFESADAYFAAYTFLNRAAAELRVPTTILASVDDPVIPAEDIAALADSAHLTRNLFEWGGHAGLIGWPPLRHHMPRIILSILEQAT